MKTEINITLPQDILDFLAVVEEKQKGYDVYVGGGYLRDLYVNSLGVLSPLTPKDLDIFFVPRICFDPTDCVREIPVIAKTYINYDTLAKDIPDMEERGVSAVRGMFVSGMSTCDVQFIVYESVFLTPLHLAEDMDMNINQIMYSVSDKTFTASSAFIDGHENMVIECLHQFDEKRMYQRYKRMMRKFPSYTKVTTLDWNALSREEALKPMAFSSCGRGRVSYVD